MASIVSAMKKEGSVSQKEGTRIAKEEEPLEPSVTPQYYLFIKSFLVNMCYNEFTKMVYEKNSTRDALIEFIADVDVWNAIFYKKEIRTTLRYFTELYSLFENTFEDSVENTFVEPLCGRTVPLYETETFQDYIDSSVKFESVGAYDYQMFTKNMGEHNFRQNMVTKYERAMLEKTLKNHIVYVTKLTIMYYANEASYFTTNEMNDIVSFVNVIPFFEYLGSRGISLDTLDDVSYADINFQTLENDVFKIIKTRVI